MRPPLALPRELGESQLRLEGRHLPTTKAETDAASSPTASQWSLTGAWCLLCCCCPHCMHHLRGLLGEETWPPIGEWYSVRHDAVGRLAGGLTRGPMYS